MGKLLLGCIADDFTGATDLANNLVRAGMRVVQAIGVPDGPLAADVDAVVVALKSRTNPVDEAVAQSLAALRWLQGQGAHQIYFKYCSTFDSTPAGNIGPVTEALMDALGTEFTIATPAFPDNKRTVFKGYLFVGDVLLSESGMQNHPLTPMADPNLVRVMQSQCRRKVGLIDHAVVARGAAAVTERIAQLKAEGVAIAIVDAVSNDDLLRMGPALAALPLVTAGVAALVLHQRARLGFWVCAVLGSALVVAFSLLRGWQQGHGFSLEAADALLVGAVVAASVGYIHGARITPALGAERVICWVCLLALPATLPATLWLWPTQPVAPSAWGGFLYVGVFSMWAGFFAWYRGLALGGALRVSQTQLLQPFFSILAAIPLLGEPLDMVTLGFAAAVVATVAVGRRMPAGN